MNPYEIDLSACRGRQQRLLEVMRARDIELAIVVAHEHVQWLTGVRFAWMLSPMASLAIDGTLTLVAPHKAPDVAAADRVVTYEAKWHSTVRNDQSLAALTTLRNTLGPIQAKRVGMEFSRFAHYPLGAVTLEDLEPDLYYLRRRKDADELAMIGVAIRATERMYAKAREIVRPGVQELEVFNALQAVAVETLGEPMTGTGNDYQCASRGGQPRSRAAGAGELYILDLGPAFRGYFADNARTIAVTQATEVQQEAWSWIMRVFEHIERTVRPGKSANALFHEVQAMLDPCPVGKFNHHLGHGIGLFPHEAPHLNPRWHDTFEVGDVFTAEPGLYSPELNAGMRIENDYRVTEDGVELLTPFALHL